MTPDFRKLSYAWLFYLLGIGIGVGSLALFLLLALLPALGLGAVTVEMDLTFLDDDWLGTLILWPFFALIWILLTWLMCAPGLWLYGKLRPVADKP